MDVIDLKNIPKEELKGKTQSELIAIIEQLRNQRAFTYEDRMKLAMLDKSPFTIWANDRDCKIVLWEGKCKSIYGYGKEVLGSNFIDLLVSDYEKRKARIDCRSIIDKETRFNNIANDVTFDKIPIILQTNCFQMKDVDSDKLLSVEFGVLTNSIQKETEKTEKAIELEKKVENLFNKISEIKKEINQHKQLTTSAKKKKLNDIFNKLSEIQSNHDIFENECAEWNCYVEYINDFERQINNCEKSFQKVKQLRTNKIQTDNNPSSIDTSKLNRNGSKQ